MLDLNVSFLTSLHKSPTSAFYGTLQPSKRSSWWRRLQDVFCLRLQKTSSSRRIYSPYLYVFKTPWSRPVYSSWSYLEDVLQKRLHDIFETSSRRFEDVFKTSSRRLQDVLQKCLQDVFKTYHQVKLFFLTRFQDVFETYSACFWDVLERRLSTEG